MNSIKENLFWPFEDTFRIYFLSGYFFADVELVLFVIIVKMITITVQNVWRLILHSYSGYELAILRRFSSSLIFLNFLI